MPYGLFTYAVDRQRIVPASYERAFSDAGSGEHLVLSACHPLYSASERILIYAHLVASQPLGAAVTTRAQQPAGPTARELARERSRKRLKLLGTRTLAIGTTGDDVKELQRLLGLPATGTFGPETAAAVSDFQRSHGLPVVGQAGAQTKAALARRPHPPSRPPTPPDVPRQQPQQSGQAQGGSQGTAQPGYSGQTGTQQYGSQGTGSRSPSGTGTP
jgi:peptidoglycan hydrolase-like protein with peptidoglycan-binding domain